MIRKITTLVACVFLLAATGPSLAKDEAALKAAAEIYVRHPVVSKVLDDMFSVDTMRSALVPQLMARGKKLRGDQLDSLSNILHEEMTRLRPQFETLLKKAIFGTFTLEEIQTLNGGF